MARKQLDLGPVLRLEARAIGSPGRRTFRLTATGRAGTAWLWLEKEELRVLGMTIEQLLGQSLAQLPLDPVLQSTARPAEGGRRAAEPEDAPSLEFRVGRLSMGYDEENDLFVLLAHDVEAESEDPETFRCQASRRQLRRLSEQISTICAAGRPRCVLCGLALNSPTDAHPCPRLN